MRELFWRHGALIDERRIVRAHSVAILQTLVEQADMCTWVPAIIGAAPPLLGRVVPLALRETFEPRRLGIITRRGGASAIRRNASSSACCRRSAATPARRRRMTGACSKPCAC